MNKNRQLKEAKVAEIKEKLEKAQGIVLAKYQGLTVEQDTKLRKSLREAGVEYKVYKNTLVTLAVKELGYEGVVPFLEGPVSIAFGYEDATAPARILLGSFNAPISNFAYLIKAISDKKEAESAE